MSRRPLRHLLRPGWLVLHVVAVAATAFMVGLGAWQWERGVELGRIQNHAYAVEWWLFAAFAVFLWVKTMADSLEDRAEEPEASAAPAVVAPAPLPAVVPDDDDDPELAAYNARLRALHEAARESDR